MWRSVVRSWNLRIQYAGVLLGVIFALALTGKAGAEEPHSEAAASAAVSRPATDNAAYVASEITRKENACVQERSKGSGGAAAGDSIVKTLLSTYGK